MKRFRRSSLAGGAVLALLLAPPARAQNAIVAVDEENFRAVPSGEVLATLLRGTPLSLGEERGQWRQATVEAWIWGRSVREQQREDLNLLVNASGENLRASPNGDRIGRAEGGMRLNRLETRGDWIRVQRTGWIWAPSIDAASEPPQDTDDAPAPRQARPRGQAAAAAPAAAPAGSGARRFTALSGAAAVLEDPAGDTVAMTRPGATVEVVARDGDWSRVRIEGWVPSGAFAPSDSVAGAVLRQIPRDSLQERPEAYRGRLVEWTVQFIALQRAERFRTDFIEGETFMLTRGPSDDPGFVYVAVGADLIDEVRGLSPLQEVRVLARVRSVRSSLTGAPVLDLLDITGR